MVFHWSVSGSKFPQISRTFLSIVPDLNNVLVWMVTSRPPISNSSKPLDIVAITPVIIGTTVIIMFHSFISSLATSKYLSLFWLSLIFPLWSAETEKVTISRSGRLAEIMWSVYILKF